MSKFNPFKPVVQCFTTAGTRPGTATWRPFYRDLKYLGNSFQLELLNLIRRKSFKTTFQAKSASFSVFWLIVGTKYPKKCDQDNKLENLSLTKTWSLKGWETLLYSRGGQTFLLKGQISLKYCFADCKKIFGLLFLTIWHNWC